MAASVAASINADFPSGNAATARVLRNQTTRKMETGACGGIWT